jgi:DNA polymerase III alpha subunit
MAFAVKFPGAGQKGSLRVGLHQLGELSKDFIKHIINTRKKKPFADLRDFLQKIKPGLPEMRILIRSGALDSLSGGVPRPALFWLYFHLKKHSEFFLLPPVPSFITDYPHKVKLRDEAATLGIIFSRHPLTIFSKRIIRMQRESPVFPLITSREIPKFVNRRVRIAGLVVTGKEVITKDNKMMTFVSFEDLYSIFETVFFPKFFARHYILLDGAGAYLISGRVEEDQGAVSISVEDIERVNSTALATPTTQIKKSKK